MTSEAFWEMFDGDFKKITAQIDGGMCDTAKYAMTGRKELKRIWMN
jgi:hypothetical protein